MKRSRIFAPIYLTLVLIALYLPIVMVVLFSFNANPSRVNITFTGFSLQWYEQLFDAQRGFGGALATSLEVAAWSVSLASVLGTLGAVGLSRRAAAKTRAQKLAAGALAVGEQVSTLPIMIPEITLGIAFLAVFTALGLPFGMVTLVLAHTTFCVPYVFILVKSRLATMDFSLVEAARDLGAGARRAFFTVTLPQILPAVLSGALLSLAMSLDDFVISFFVNGAETTTLPLKVYSSVKVGVSPQVNALCTVMLGVVFLAVASGQLLSGGRRKKRGNSKQK